MRQFRILIYEDDPDWVDGFKYNLEPKLSAVGVKLILTHKLDGSTAMQDVQMLPDLILIDFDLGEHTGEDILNEIEDDPQLHSLSIYFYSGGESIESLRSIAANYSSGIHCYVKEGDSMENAIISKGKGL